MEMPGGAVLIGRSQLGDETSLKIKASIFPGGLSPHAPLNTPLAGNDVALSIVRTNN